MDIRLFLILNLTCFLPSYILVSYVFSLEDEALLKYYTELAREDLEEMHNRAIKNRRLQQEYFDSLSATEKNAYLSRREEESQALAQVVQQKKLLRAAHQPPQEEWADFVARAERFENAPERRKMQELVYTTIREHPNPNRAPVDDFHADVVQALITIVLIVLSEYLRGRFGGNDEGSEDSD